MGENTCLGFSNIFAEWHCLWSSIFFTTVTRWRYVRNAKRTVRICICTALVAKSGLPLVYYVRYRQQHSGKVTNYHGDLASFSALGMPVVGSPSRRKGSEQEHMLHNITGAGRLQKDAAMRARKVRRAQQSRRTHWQQQQSRQILETWCQKRSRDSSFVEDMHWWKKLAWLSGQDLLNFTEAHK